MSASPNSRVYFPLLMCLLLGACASPAPLKLDAPQTPARFEGGPSAASAAGPAATWWQAFQDPELDALQAHLLQGNENLRASLAQLEAARAALGQLRAAQAPGLGLSGAASREGSGGATGSEQTRLRLDLTASWEPDLWGRLSLAAQAGEARLQASEADLAALRLSAQATLTQSYVELRSAEAQQALIERSISAYQRSLALTQARYQSGVVPASDVLQAETQLKTAQVQALEAGNQRALAAHAIAVLLGQAPGTLKLAVSARLPEPPAAPELLPAELLRRRPDLRAAEHRVAAARAQWAEAGTAFFPSLSLSATLGRRASSLAELWDAPALAWSLGPALALKLLDGGGRDAAQAQARAQAEQAGAQYRQAVLLAWQEVEGKLWLHTQLQAQAELQRQALQAAQRNLDISQEQYRVGTVSYLNVVTAQTAALSSERSLLDLQSRRLSALNLLLRNLGGPW